MALKLMGRKRGMVQLFDENGNIVPCTVVEMEPNVVVQVKTKDSKDGYNAIQMGFEKIKAKDPRRFEKRVGKPMKGHFAKGNAEPRKFLKESRIEKSSEYTAGQEIGVEAFADLKFVDVTSVSKGKGFQGVIKKYNFAGGPASHGSGFHRHAGSTGMRSTPGRCFPGGPRPSHMGDVQVTVQNLQIVKIDVEGKTLVIKGAVPGAVNALVWVSQAEKKYAKK